jgi:hypothetical protein
LGLFQELIVKLKDKENEKSHVPFHFNCSYYWLQC